MSGMAAPLAFRLCFQREHDARMMALALANELEFDYRSDFWGGESEGYLELAAWLRQCVQESL